MMDQTRQKALSRWIYNALSHGIILTDDVLAYLDATFGTRDLPSVLADADASEIDSMLELLFYPDLQLQVSFETQWGRECISELDQVAVIDYLRARRIVADVTLPETGAKFSIPVPAFVSQTFVQRMNMCWQPTDRLARAIDTHCCGERHAVTRVRLRNCGLAWHEDQVGLIARFVSQMPTQSTTYDTDLNFLITIMSELTLGKDHFDFLIAKKFFYFLSLCRAEDFDRRRQSSNMEIMMMTGPPAAHGNMDEWRRNMRRIDRICQALFGRTQFFRQPDSQYINLEDGLNMHDVMDKLS